MRRLSVTGDTACDCAGVFTFLYTAGMVSAVTSHSRLRDGLRPLPLLAACAAGAVVLVFLLAAMAKRPVTLVSPFGLGFDFHDSYDAAKAFQEKRPGSDVAKEAAMTLVNLAHMNAGRYGETEPRWFREFARQAQFLHCGFAANIHIFFAV